MSYVTRLERAVSAPGIDLVQRLADALGASVQDLLPTGRTDPLPLLKEQARLRFESILAQADQPALSLLVPWLTIMDDELAKRR